ncbi:MAG: FAD binding domain-containing protein [Sphaerochaetaceae bacterium]
MNCKEYIKPKKLAELEELLKTTDEKAAFLAGGTDVIVKSRETDEYADCVLIDIYGIKELQEITEDDDNIYIGACCTHTQIVNNSVIKKYANVLSMACSTVGSLLTRNHSTIGGNICNASPAADSISSLMVLDAKVTILHEGSKIEKNLEDLIIGPGENSLLNKDLVTCIRIKKLKENTLSDFYKLGRRKALAISRMTISVILHKDNDGIVDDFNIAIGATFPRPMVFNDVNNIPIGKKLSQQIVEQIASAISKKIPEIAGIRKSTAYKQPVCERLVKRMLLKFI